MFWSLLHIIVLTLLVAFCAHITRIVFKHVVFLVLCISFLVMASAIGIIVDAHITHAQMTSHSRHARHQRFYMQTPIITVAGFSESDAHQMEITTPDYKGLTTHLQHCLITRQECRTTLGPVEVHSGLPSAEEVQKGQNTIVLYSGGSWHGLFPQNPRFNRLLKVCGGLTESVLGFRAAGSLKLPFPVVAFDYPTGRLSALNCGQTDDTAILDYMYQKVTKTFPSTKIIVMADCLGSLRVMNWLATKPANMDNLKSVLLESPLTELRHFLNGLSSNKSMNELAFKVLAFIMPNYHSSKEKEFCFSSFPHTNYPQVPVFVGIINEDLVSNQHSVDKVMEKFPESEALFFVARNEFVDGQPLKHGQLVRCASYVSAVKEFLSCVNLLQKPKSELETTFPVQNIALEGKPKLQEST